MFWLCHIFYRIYSGLKLPNNYLITRVAKQSQSRVKSLLSVNPVNLCHKYSKNWFKLDCNSYNLSMPSRLSQLSPWVTFQIYQLVAIYPIALGMYENKFSHSSILPKTIWHCTEGDTAKILRTREISTRTVLNTKWLMIRIFYTVQRS